MKTVRVALLVLVLFTVCKSLSAQTIIGRQKVDQFTVNASGGLTYGLTWLPTDYNATTTRYPLIIFLHGMGENGSTVNDLYKLISTALPMKIAQGWDPVAVNPVNNQTYKFIVVSPQAPFWSYGYPQLQYILNDVINKYRVDTTRIYFTGLSAGGAGTNASVTNGPALAMRVAAIVPVAAAGTNTPAEGANIPLIGGTYGVKVWNICGTQDQFWNLTVAITDSINNATPPPAVPAILTPLNNVGHTSVAWNTAYEPTWRTNSQNLNIYEWMLKYTRANGPAYNPPSVNAGPDQTITLPANSITLNGTATDSDGTISSYLWTKISGPALGNIASPNQAQTVVNNLTTGTYVFRLTATDNTNFQGSDEVTVTVNPAPVYTTIPAKIEAENWYTMSGVQTETTLDAGGGLNVGWIDNGDWMDYNVNSAAATRYQVKIRVATPNNGAQLQLRRSDGTVLATVAIPNSGGYQAWQTVTTHINLPAGQQTIRVISSAAPVWNFNWIDFSFPPPPPPPGLIPNANNFSTYIPYHGKYSYGMNPGYYGPNWSAQNMANLAMGNPAVNVKGVGAKSLRVPIYDDFVTTWGLTSLLSDYQFYSSLGANEITAFVGMPHPTHRETITYPGSPEQAKTFKNLYDPIWLDSAQTIINPNNYYAKYLFDVVTTYGPYVKFWEIVNEPDFTWSSAGWMGDIHPPLAGSWFDHDPTPAELVNLRAPIEHYIRMLRISWEVIKKLQPNDYVCTGGIGYIAFLDAILRNTDNPVDGSVTPEYPLKGGAYFDILSFHNYPMYNLRAWNSVTGTVDQFRHSDAASNAFIDVKKRMDSILGLYGYNHVQFPRKQFICTETGVSRIMGPNGEWGSNEGQRNYMIKAHIAAQKNKINQVYWFQLGDATNPSEQFDRMGTYYYFGANTPHNATKADQGIAMKTTSDLLFNATYDSVRTAALNLPASVSGGAFKRSDNSYIYVLWAKTTTDLSEVTSATYSFPGSIINTGYVTKKLWNFSETNAATTISSTGIALDGSPVFFEATTAPPPNQLPVVNAGNDQTITLPTNSVTFHGTASDPDGTISGYQWTKISGPTTYTITSPSSASTTITGLVQGVYEFRLTATDNNNASASDTITVTVNAAPNQSPAANAGSDQTITLPANSVALNGTGNDPDGSITGYTWVKITGPSQYTIVSPSSAQTTVNNLAQGVYTFELTVTDNHGATGKDTVAITVNAAPPPPNNAPTANAGTDITITLPTNSVTLHGSGTDSDGSIVNYQWTKVSGPTQHNIVNPASAQTVVNNLVEGTYLFELTVTDNNGATGKDTVAATVSPQLPPPNQLPTANAGNDINITLPVNTVTLQGSANDPDGTVVSVNWTKISGPAQYVISNPNRLQTSVTSLVQGSYQFRLEVTDNAGAAAADTVVVTVVPASPPPNQLPSVNAGPHQTITLPANSVTLNGTATDADGNITAYTWAKISGPAQYVIANPSSAQTAVNNLTQGVYAFELTVTDNDGGMGKDTIQITVLSAPNQPPAANAGQDQAITLPTNRVTLNGSGSDADGSVVSYQWIKISGPSACSIANATQPQTAVSNLVIGNYQFELVVTDNGGATGRDTVTIIVNQAPNVPPIANAGLDQNITLPNSTITLSGSGTDNDGTITGYQWRQIAGPAQAIVAAPNQAQTSVGGLAQGTYRFELTVTDDRGGRGKDTVQVTVNAAPNIPPVVVAGRAQTITLPTDSVMVHAIASDPDGTIVSYSWRKVSGPSTFYITSPQTAGTAIKNLVEGTYQFEITVTDNRGASATDVVSIQVLPDNRRRSVAYLYPNPASNYVVLEIDAITQKNETQINIYNFSGVLVHTESFDRSQQTITKRIHIETLPRGTYIIAVNTDINTTQTFKFIKQ